MTALCVIAGFALSACGGGGSDSSISPSSNPSTPTNPTPNPPAAKREWFAADELLAANASEAAAAASADSPVDNAFYMPLASAQAGANTAPAAALHEFRGRLIAGEQSMTGTTPDSNYGQNGLLQFPGFAADFITVDGYLVPVQRDILPRNGTRSLWRIILSPGRVWSESSDGNWSRASFPFVLACDSTNEAHNGIATFVFNDSRVSALQFQIVQETASWDRNDFWGRAVARYIPEPVPNEAPVRQDFRDELAALTPARPWSQLAGPHDDDSWNEFVRGLDSDDFSAAGIVDDGVVYHRACTSRLGDYPYCEFMRHGAFSLTKSMGAALTLMRLAQKYGEEVYSARIADYVAVSASHHGWDDVRFIDVLNMATGVGDGNPNRFASDPFSDENAVTLGAWSNVPSAAEKLEAVFRQHDYHWGPGEVFRYNTTQTFVLAVAMQNYLASREGPDGRLWEMMVREVFSPIGIRHVPMMRTAENGGDVSAPLLGIGMYPTIDDVAKIATLLQNRGRHNGVQLLHRRGLDDALFRTNKGLRTGERNSAGLQRYWMSLWSWPHRTQGHCTEHIPYMEGYGGNYVVLMPNGLTAFRFADAGNYDVEALVDVAERIRPWCQ